MIKIKYFIIVSPKKPTLADSLYCKTTRKLTDFQVYVINNIAVCNQYCSPCCFCFVLFFCFNLLVF